MTTPPVNTLPEFLKPYIESPAPLRFSSEKLQTALDQALAKVPAGKARAQLRVDLDGAYALGIKRFGEDWSLSFIGGIDWETRQLEGAVELIGSFD